MNNTVNTQMDSKLWERYAPPYSRAMDIGKRLDEAMKAKGIRSQSELSRKAGVPQPTINRILKGTTPNPDLNTIKKLCDALGVTVQQMTDSADYVGMPSPTSTQAAGGLADRLNAFMRESRLSIEELSDVAGVSEAVGRSWLAGSEASFTLEHAARIQEKHNVNAIWLIMGRGKMSTPGVYAEDPFDPIPIPPGVRIPVVGTAQLGDDGHWAELDYPVGHGDGYLDFPSRDKDAYGVRCKGDSMMPRIKDGEFVVIEPNRKVDHGDEVLVKAKDGRVMVKIYLYAAQGRTHLMSVNTAHAPIAINSDQIERLHYVAAIVKPALWLFG
ncbi:helix-turn-helix domain-containing protein [Paraburkholderia bannensis]|uniref:helix-turn-helix domain-containing protein n=1 Tax=Paraburkholderia bannensis TaxID=765414 RepID=UPI002AB5F415|nr:S24 family peptidase [Paraburkholderia bannensis]